VALLANFGQCISVVFYFQTGRLPWKEVNLGAWQKEFELPPDAPYGSLASSGGVDFLLEVKEAATYRFEVFAGNREKPVVVVRTSTGGR
jgi:hypothetical protein